MSHLSYHRAGQNNWHSTRPSDHRRSDANRRHWHGPVVGMDEPGLLARAASRIATAIRERNGHD